MNETVLAVILILAAACVIGLSITLIVTRPRSGLPGGAPQRPLRENEMEARAGARRVIISHAQHIGARPAQQDAYGFTADERALVVALCDGMGGMAMGTEAARLATDVLLDISRGDFSDAAEALAAAMNAANDAVYSLCRGRGGTTAVLARLDGAGLSYAAAGDSRIYLYRAGALTQLGTDHVLYYDLIRSGAVSPDEATAHPERGHLTSYLGRELLTRVNTTDMPLSVFPGDAVLLISDGVSKTVDEQQIARAIQNGANASDIAAKALFAQNPHQDNLTCILVRVVG